MNLEQRVQVLEQEVQLLKAQIQATLLDMQEQLLNAKYPILRAEEPVSAAPAPAAAPAASASPVRRVVLTEPEPEEAPVDVRPARSPAAHISDDVDVVPAAVKVRSNSYPFAPAAEPPGFNAADWEDEEYEQPRASRVAEAPKPRRGKWEEEEYGQPRQPRITEPPMPADDEAARDWIELENWVSQKVEKLGINRTRELINLYTRQERFSRQERELLLQFVSIYDGTSKPASAQQSKAAAARSSAPAERPSIVPQTRAVVEEIRNELRQKRNAAKNKTETYPLSEQQELVMRLIAGILNAGDDDESSKHSF
ncbi:MAG: hypothetical protein IT319_16165 [Anaerolineae bacterium]|nr:hypothetical protein [Anaerolineae bacterium]